MKRIPLFLLLVSFSVYGQCTLPVKSCFGLIAGGNYGILDPDDEGGNYSGMGMEIGIGTGMLPGLSPYLGLGFAENFQLSGEVYIGDLSSSIEDLENDLSFLIAFGSDIKFIKIKLSPEFEFDFRLGLYYTP